MGLNVLWVLNVLQVLIGAHTDKMSISFEKPLRRWPKLSETIVLTEDHVKFRYWYFIARPSRIDRCLLFVFSLSNNCTDGDGRPLIVL